MLRTRTGPRRGSEQGGASLELEDVRQNKVKRLMRVIGQTIVQKAETKDVQSGEECSMKDGTL